MANLIENFDMVDIVMIVSWLVDFFCMRPYARICFNVCGVLLLLLLLLINLLARAFCLWKRNAHLHTNHNSIARVSYIARTHDIIVVCCCHYCKTIERFLGNWFAHTIYVNWTKYAPHSHTHTHMCVRARTYKQINKQAHQETAPHTNSTDNIFTDIYIDAE